MNFLKTHWVAMIAIVIAIIACAFVLTLKAAPKAGTVQATTDVTTTAYTSASVSNGISIGGIFLTGLRTAALTQSSTTPCAIQSPNATSSLTNASILLTTSSTTASTVTIATSTTAFATTSLIESQSVSANTQATITFDGGVNNSVVAPSTWVVFGMQGGTGTFSPAGVCEALFQVLN